MEKKTNPSDNVIDFREFLYKILNNWFYFLISIVLALSVAFAYTRYSKELYKVSTKVLIIDNESSAYKSLYNQISDQNNASIKDESEKLLSYGLVFQTVSELEFDKSYYLVGNIKTSESFSAPVKIVCDTSITQNNPSYKFEIDIIDETSYKLDNEKLDYEEEHNFGDTIQIQSYNFVVERNYDYKSEILPKTIVEFNKLKAVAIKYKSKIQIENHDKESNVLDISILEEDQRKGVKFLNTLVRNYINNDIERRKESSLKIVNYFHDKIQEIEDDLSIVDMRLEDYKRSHQTPDIGFEIQKIYSKLSGLEQELSTYEYQDKYYSSLEGDINNVDVLEKIISLPTDDIIQTDPMLVELIRDRAKQQRDRNKLIEGGQINNPSISDFNLEIAALSREIKEFFNNSKQTNRLMIEELNEDIEEELEKLSELPMEQRELIDIARLQEFSSELYTFLKQKNYEAESKYEGVVSSIDHFEPARFFNKNPVQPRVYRVYSIALLIGISLPFLILLLLDVMNDKIRSRMDLEKLTDIEIIGVIGRNHSARSLLTNLNPKSSIAEGFRALRSNLSYKNIEGKDKVYLVTSSVSGEGKTFLASNLAIVFSNAGRKTLLLGGDLRRPKLYEAFDSDNRVGLTTILNEETSVEECIIRNVSENLDVIVSGPLPPNPADIFLSEKFDTFIKSLISKYDKIIIDTAPVGLVADAYMITKHTDVNLYVVRQDYTKKEVLQFANDLNENNRIENLYLVLNDVGAGSGVYGYGKYGYGYNYGGYSYGYGTYVSDSDYFDEKEN